MPKKYLRAAVSGLFLLLLFSVDAAGQDRNAVEKTLRTTGKVTVIVVGKTAEASYKTAKFAARRIVKPVVVRSAPKAGKFVVRQGGRALKRSFPVGRKLFFKYVRYRIGP